MWLIDKLQHLVLGPVSADPAVASTTAADSPLVAILRRTVRWLAPVDERVPWEAPLAPSTVQRVLTICGLADEPALATARLLDFGCGNGRYLEAFATRLDPSRLVGMEVESSRLREVRDKGLPCVWVGPTQGALPFADATFDVVFSSNVIEHIPRPLYLQVLRELHRVIRPGGRLVVGTPNYPIKRLYDLSKAFATGPLEYYLFDDPTHCNKLSIGQLRSDLEALFAEVHLWPTYLAGQRRFGWLRRPAVRQRLGALGDKVLGYGVKGPTPPPA